MALLLGSDYTEGVHGVGVVNAIEIVNEFPGREGLRRFKQWCDTPLNTLGLTETKARNQKKKKEKEKGRKKGEGKGKENEKGKENGKGKEEGEGEGEGPVVSGEFHRKHASLRKKWDVPASFPNDRVIDEYLSPKVDPSKDSFRWGKPDVVLLQAFCRGKFGWDGEKTKEALMPVLEAYEAREMQLRMENFFGFSERFANIRSKRVAKAIQGVKGKSKRAKKTEGGGGER